MCRTKARNPTKQFPKQKRHKVHEVNEDDSETESEAEQHFFVAAIGVDKKKKKTLIQDNELFVETTINSLKVRLKVDTGAQANILPLYLFKELNKNATIKMMKTKQKLTSYSGDKIEVVGKCTLNVMNTALEFYVTDTKEDPILGLKASQQLQLIKVMTINKEKAEKKNTEIFDEYPDVFKGIGCLQKQYHIEIDKDIRPVHNPARRIPFSLKERVKKELDKMEQLGVIKKQEDYTDWASPMVVVEKPNKSLRICLDPRDLNKAIKREKYIIPNSEEITAKLAGAKYFSKFDATSGFWQIKLDAESSKLCTMNTPFGLYSFQRCPFGISSAPEIFNKYMRTIFEGLDGIESFFDDVIVWGNTWEELKSRERKCLEVARQNNLKFNKDKTVLGAQELKYLGHIICSKGSRPDPEKIKAIKEMSIQDKKGLQRYLGMVTYVGKFIPNLSEITKPLRDLLQKDVVWQWTHSQEEAVKTVYKAITNSGTLRHFDPRKEVTVTADSSQYGLGAALLQDGHVISYASRSLNTAERNYAQIEKEALSVVFACEKFHQFIYGRPITVENDHKPLESIFKKSLSNCPPRIQRFMLKLQKYDIAFKYRPGKEMVIADTLSRDPLQEIEPDESTSDIDCQVHMILQNVAISKQKQEEIKTATMKELSKLQSRIKSGWPTNKKDCELELREYWDVKETLTAEEGFILRNEQIVIPPSMRKEMLQKIHEGHLGTTKCKDRARRLLYWPRMSHDITDLISKCNTCLRHRNKQIKEPVMDHEKGEYPWQKLGTDIFCFEGKEYLLVADYYSRFFEVVLLKDMKSSTLIAHFKAIFARFGIPEILISDNAANYTSKEF